ncbi:MAG: hypothetical protein QM709_15735 [Spongiibacteraceae bacterium]
MYKTTAAIVAERIIVDKATNKASLIDTYDEISSQSFPISLQTTGFFFLIARTNTDAPSFTATTSIKLDNIVLFQQDMAVDFHNGLIARVMLNFQGLTIPSAGTLTATIKQKDSEIGQASVIVKRLDLPPFSIAVDQSTN